MIINVTRRIIKTVIGYMLALNQLMKLDIVNKKRRKKQYKKHRYNYLVKKAHT
jgi:hypothetical protein